MNKSLLVVRTMLKMHFSKAGKSNSQMVLFIIAGLFLFPFLFVYLNALNNLVSSLFEILDPVGQSSIILGMLFLILSVLLFIISCVTIISAFYFAEDIESFIPFPLQPYHILFGKAAVPFLYLYATTAALFLPVYFSFSSLHHTSILEYVYGLVIFLLLPLIPFTIAAVIIMFLMRFVNIAKNKDRSKVLAGIFVLSLIIIVNVVLRLNTDQESMLENLAYFIQEQDGLLHMITQFYPPALFGTKALTAGGWGGLLNFLLIIISSIISILLFIWFGQRFYLKGVLGINISNKKNISSEKVFRRIRKRAVWVTYIQKELRIIFRTPTFFIQCVIQSLFGPVFLFIILLMDTNSVSLSGALQMFSDKHSLLIIFAATLFILSANATGISSLSREGKNWHTNLFLPFETKLFFLSKIATASIINLVSVLLVGILLIVILKIELVLFFFWLILILIASWFTSLMGTYLDFSQPKLNWSDEQEVFKARLIGLLALLYEFVPLGILVLFIWNLDFISGLIPTFILLFISLIIYSAIIHYLLHKKIANRDHQKLI
ncbi:putative ABC transporter permease subunit [Ornithinibacillus salinisoli]